MSEPDVVVDVDARWSDGNFGDVVADLERKGLKAGAAMSRLGKDFVRIKSEAAQASTGVGRISTNLTKAGREALVMTKAFQEVAAATSTINQGLRNLQSEISKSKALQNQQIVAERRAADRARQAELVAAQAANARLNIEAQRAAQSQLISQRQSGQQRIQITRGVLETIGRLEKGFGVALAGTARSVTSGLGRAFDTVTARIRNTNRTFTDGTSQALLRREGLLRSSFTRQERLLSQSVTRQQATVQRLNRSLSTGALGAVTGRAGVAGIGGGLGVLGLLKSGFERYSNLERINKQFIALTGNATEASALLEEVKLFAKETPFDLVGVADLAKGFLAIGTSTEDVIPRVQAIADAVALTGGGVDELNRIQRAIGQVVSAGRLQGDELNQLAENLPGLNIRQILADQLTGGNVRTLVEMQEAGEITSDLFVNGLITGLAGDPRLVGASEDLANTLSGRVANLKESFADFGASIIGTIAEPLKAATSGAQIALQGLSDFVKGEVGPGLQTLRDALAGAAGAMGLVVGAKAAGEVLQFVAVSARLLVTPLGLVLTAAGLIGATFNVMRERSVTFRMALDALSERFRGVASAISDRFGPAITQVADWVGETILGALDRLAAFLSGTMLDAFDAAVSFIVNTAIPSLVAFGQTVANIVVPAVVRAGQLIASGFVVARDAVVAFAETVQPYIQPAIDGFQRLGSAIGDAIGGDFGGLASGATAALSGIGATLANVATSALRALEPVGRTVIDSLKAIFTLENLTEVGKAALNVVEVIGYALGNIVSDPRFITALAAVAAAAALVAARFVEGVARGIAENLPELVALALGGLKAVLSAIVTEVLFDPGVFALAVTGALLAPSLIKAFKAFGEQGAGSFIQGFRSKVQDAGGVLQGLFGSQAGLAQRADANALVALQRDATRLQATVRSLGSAMRVEASTSSIKAATAEVDRLSKNLTDAQLRGLRLRDALTQTFRAISFGVSGVTEGLGQMIAGLNASGLGPAGGGRGRVSSAIETAAIAGLLAIDKVKAGARNLGSEVNIAFGGVGTGLTTVFNRARSGLETAGIAGLLAIDKVKAGARNLGAEVNTAFGGVASGVRTAVSTVTGAIGRMARSVANAFLASGAVTRGRQYASNIAAGISSGASTIKAALSLALADLRRVAQEQGTTVGRVLGQQVASGAAVALGGFVAGRAEGQAGGNGVLSALGAGLTGLAIGGPVVGAAAAGLALIGTAVGNAKKATEDAAAAAADYADAIRTDLGGAFEIGADGAITFAEALRAGSEGSVYGELETRIKSIVPLLNEAGVSQQELIAAFIEGGEAYDEIIRKIGGREIGSRRGGGFFDIDLNPFDAPNTAPIYENQAAVDLLSRTYTDLAAGIREVNDLVAFRGSSVPLAEQLGFDTIEPGNLDDAIRSYSDLRSEIETPAEPRFTERMQSALDDAKAAADEVSLAIDRMFVSRDPEGLKAAFDAAVLSVAGAFDGLVVGGNIVDQAALDSELLDLQQRISSVASQGLNEGVIYDEATLRQQTLGILAAALDGVEDPSLRAAISAAYEEGFANAVPIVNAQNVFDQIAAGLDEAGLTVPVELDSGALEQAAGNMSVQAGTLGRRTADAYAGGLEAGVRAKAASIARAAISVVQNMAAAVDNFLGIASPSRLAIEQGGWYGEGFAKGIGMQSAVAAEAAQQLSFGAVDAITNSSALADAHAAGYNIGRAIADGLIDADIDIFSVVDDAVSSAVAKIGSLGSDQADAVAAATARLFADTTGTDAARSGGLASFQIGGAAGGITDSLQGFLTTFDSNVARIFEVNGKKLNELNAAEREIYGTNVFGLDASTVFGASNLKGIGDYFDSVAELGEELLAKGRPVGEVAAALQVYIDDFITTASNLGFDTETLVKLVQELGLSGPALEEFAKQVQAINEAAAAGPSAKALADLAEKNAQDEDRSIDRLPRVSQTFIVQLPTGDPQANALAVANRQASIYALPGG